VCDIVVEDTVIVELKSLRRLVSAREIQLVNYLVATGKPVGLVLNFGEREVEVKRADSVNHQGTKTPWRRSSGRPRAFVSSW